MLRCKHTELPGRGGLGGHQQLVNDMPYNSVNCYFSSQDILFQVDACVRIPAFPELQWNKMRHTTPHPLIPAHVAPIHGLEQRHVPASKCFAACPKLALKSKELIWGAADELGSNPQQGTAKGSQEETVTSPLSSSFPELSRGTLVFACSLYAQEGLLDQGLVLHGGP